MSPRLSILGIGLLIAAVLVVLWSRSCSSEVPENSVTETTSSEEKVISPPPSFDFLPHYKEERTIEMMDHYGSQSSSPQQDLELIWQIFETFDTTIKPQGKIPLGSNREIAQVLLGANLRQIRFVKPKASVFNEQGEIIDRWKMPLFFHFIEGNDLGLRSAGPDRRMWTKDDVTFGEGAVELGETH